MRPGIKSCHPDGRGSGSGQKERKGGEELVCWPSSHAMCKLPACLPTVRFGLIWLASLQPVGKISLYVRDVAQIGTKSPDCPMLQEKDRKQSPQQSLLILRCLLVSKADD